MHVVLCPDEAYAEHAAVVIASVLANVAEPHRVHIWIAANGLGERSRGLLAKVVRRAGAQIGFLSVDTDQLKGVPLGAHITVTSYYRLLVPGHLPPAVDRFLYLDSDLVVEDDIAPLFSVNLAGHVLAAVGNLFTWHEQLGLPSDMPYFNAGVLMIDRGR
jgi:lipopolysaccharide biosynthesis glycosyltransferase